MHRCVLMILFVLSLIFEAHSAFAYGTAIPKFDMITNADGGEWWIPAGQYKVDPNKRNKSSFAKDLGIPEEMFNKPSPEFEERKRGLIVHNIDYNPYIDVASRFVCNLMYTAGYFAADMFIPGGVDNLRKYLSHEISSSEYAKRVAVDIAVTVEATAAGAIIGGMNGGAGGLALAGVGVVPGSIAGAVTGATTGFVGSRITVATARTAEKSGTSSKGGTGFEKEPKEPKLREVKIEKPNEVKQAKSERVVLEYGKGKFWDGLISKKQDKSLESISRRTQSKIKKDSDGYFYKFDPAHKTAKVHLHKYKHNGGNKYKLIAEVNPETGEIKVIEGKIEIW